MESGGAEGIHLNFFYVNIVDIELLDENPGSAAKVNAYELC